MLRGLFVLVLEGLEGVFTLHSYLGNFQHVVHSLASGGGGSLGRSDGEQLMSQAITQLSLASAWEMDS